MNKAETPPTAGRHFYSIIHDGDDLVDVYLNPDPRPLTTEDGFTDYSITAIVVRDVDPNDERFGGDLEAHIRAHYKAWCESGIPIEI